MRFTSKDKLIDLLQFAEQQTIFIIQTTHTISNVQDFLTSLNGMVLFNSTCMCLQSIGEAIRQVDNKTEGKLFALYPQTPWKQIIGMRNIISHEYLSIDPDLIFDIVCEELTPLSTSLHTVLADISAGLRDDVLNVSSQ